MKVLDLLSLRGRNALVTGGSRGLGLQMAEALGEMGARVAITARKKDELEEAVRIANDSPYGLAGAVWSKDDARAQKVARRIRAGQVDVNGGAFNMNAPFGGFKQSGHGREAGVYGLEEFLEYKSLQLKG